jgi:hypothetical protein
MRGKHAGTPGTPGVPDATPKYNVINNAPQENIYEFEDEQIVSSLLDINLYNNEFMR